MEDRNDANHSPGAPHEASSNSGGPSGSLSDCLPPGWAVLDLGEGCVWVGRTPHGSPRLLASWLPGALAWNSMFFFLLRQREVPLLARLLVLAPLAGIGLALALRALWDYLGHDEWVFGPNRVERRWGWRCWPHRWTLRVEDGHLLLIRHRNGDAHTLLFYAPDANREIAFSGDPGPRKLDRLAEQVGRLVGWPLYEKVHAGGEPGRRITL